MEKVTTTLSDFEAEAERFAKELAPREKGAYFITLSGELGAGKTAFAKVVAKTLGVESVVTSPTFVLEKIYPLPKGKPFQKLIHIDAYRLRSAQDLGPLHFAEYTRDAQNIILLEWPEMIADEPHNATVKISIALLQDGSRRISYA